MSQIVTSGGISTPVTVANGGTGATSITSGKLVEGNGTSAFSAFAGCAEIPEATDPSSAVTRRNQLIGAMKTASLMLSC